LGCEANYEIARLALGQSLALSELPPPAPDGKGLSLKGLQLFGSESDANYLWIALLGEQLRMDSQQAFSLDGLQKLVRDHWHRGVYLLMEDWQKSGEDFARFLDILARKAALPETIQREPSLGGAPALPIAAASKEDGDRILKQLRAIGIAAEIRDSVVGPRLTRFKMYLSNAGDFPLFRNKLEQLGFALGIGGSELLLYEADEPQTCFLEQPRKKEAWQTVGVDCFDSAARNFCGLNMVLPVSPGVDVAGRPVVFDLADAPHLLVGGTTGSGKSVCINALLLSLVMAAQSRPIRLALIDPKQVEFSMWRDCPCLYADIAASVSSGISLLDDLVLEMENRYTRFAELGVKNLVEARERGFDGERIVVAVDELADLVMQDKTAEKKLVQLAQKSRAAGIHLILATQRPDAATFTGLLRSNCPARIALKVQKSSESGIILDEPGAELLLGAGDMLIKGAGMPIQRAHGYLIHPDEITARIRQLN